MINSTFDSLKSCLNHLHVITIKDNNLKHWINVIVTYIVLWSTKLAELMELTFWCPTMNVSILLNRNFWTWLIFISYRKVSEYSCFPMSIRCILQELLQHKNFLICSSPSLFSCIIRSTVKGLASAAGNKCYSTEFSVL